MERKNTLIKGHLNVFSLQSNGGETVFKTQFEGKHPCTANDRHTVFTCSLQNPFIDTYAVMDPTGKPKSGHKRGSGSTKTQVNIKMISLFT